MSGGTLSSGDDAYENKPRKRQNKLVRREVYKLSKTADQCRANYENGNEADKFQDFARDFHRQDLSNKALLKQLAVIIYANNPMTCAKCKSTDFTEITEDRFVFCRGCGLKRWITAGSFFQHLKAPILTLAMLGLLEAGIIFNPSQFAEGFGCRYSTAHNLFGKFQHVISEKLQNEAEITLLNTRAFVGVTTRRSWNTPAQMFAASEQGAAEKDAAEIEAAEAQRPAEIADLEEEPLGPEVVEEEAADQNSVSVEGDAEMPPQNGCTEAFSNNEEPLASGEDDPVGFSDGSESDSPLTELFADDTESLEDSFDSLRMEGNKIIDVLQKSDKPLSLDALLELCDMTLAALSSALTILELDKLICPVPGGFFALANSDIALEALRYTGDKSESPAKRKADWEAKPMPGWPLPRFLQRFANSFSLLIKAVHQGISRKRLGLYSASHMFNLRAKTSGATMPLRELFAGSNWGSRDDIRKLKCPLAVGVYALSS